MADQWRTTNLSTILPALSKSLDNLKSSLGSNNAECNRNIEDLEAGIKHLIKAFSPQVQTHSADGNAKPLIRELAERARNTLWDDLPVDTIANAHREKADDMVSRGNVTGNAVQLSEIYIEYAKYLLLHPVTNNDPVYHHFVALEKTMTVSVALVGKLLQD
ncbi:hypothetical protein B0H13DRAFT_2442216 [Mycena leptocephala]|nr:hypothetical protein B0H13DRAFT_2442216 [Mycena leptocephala]